MSLDSLHLPGPEVPGRRQRRREETAQRILSSAVRLFEKNGYTPTTVEQITEAADVAKGTFFNYFPSKEHLLLNVFALVRLEFERLEKEAPTATDVRAHLRGFARNFLASPSRTNIVRNVIGLAVTEPLIGEAFQTTLLKARAAVSRVFERGQKLGQVRTDISALLLARTFQQFILGTEIVYSVSGGNDLQQWLDTMFEIFWSGAAPAKTGARSASVGKPKRSTKKKVKH